MRKANYTIEEDLEGRPLVIRDVGPWDAVPTVTNCAEAVVAELTQLGKLPTGRRLFYYDSEGSLDEILVKEYGRFAGFGPGPARGGA